MKRYLYVLFVLIMFLSCKKGIIGETKNSQEANEAKPVFISNNFLSINELQSKLHGIAKNETPSVVFIGTEKIIKQKYMDPFDFFFKSPWDWDERRKDFQPKEREYKQSGLGSGVIYFKRGKEYFIITNNHVVEGVDKIQVTIDQKKFYAAKLVGTDPRVDIAVIKIETEDTLQVAKFGDSDKLNVGDFVIAIGNPFGLYGTMTFGIISALGRTDIASDRLNLTNFIQTDAAINPGNSGGPLINLDGEVIGINTMIYSQSGGNIGIGFAIPVNIAKSTADQLIDKGKVEHGYLGVYFQELTDETIKKLDLKTDYGMLVNSVFENSPAEKAGIKAGDIIIELNGKPLRKSTDLTIPVGNSKPGTKINLTVLRDNKKISIDVILGVRDEEKIVKESKDKESLKDGKVLEDYGIELVELDSNLRTQYRIPNNLNGVLINRVYHNSPAFDAGLKEGDLIFKINNKNIKNISDVENILKESNDFNYFFIFRNGRELIVRM